MTISDNEETQPSRMPLQTPDVLENDKTQASSAANTAPLEEKHGISAIEKAARKSEQQDMLQRAESAEARCKELEEQVEVARSRLDLQTHDEDFEERLRDLNPTVLRKYVRDLHLQRDKIIEQASKARVEERKRTELKFKNVQEIEKESKGKLKHLEQRRRFEEEQSKRKIEYLEEQAAQSEEQSQQKIKQLEQQVRYMGEESQRKTKGFEQQLKYLEEESQRITKHLEKQLEYQKDESLRKIRDVEEQAKQMEQHHKESMKREMSSRMRLRRDVLDVKSGIVIFRTKNGSFPVEYDYSSVCGRWKDNMVECLDELSRNPELPENAPETTLREDPSLPGLEASLQMVAGIPEMPSGDLDIDSIFENSLEAPSCYNITMACFIARVVRWCFDTDWHIDEPECTRMEEVWSAVARIGTQTGQVQLCELTLF
jgi:hypothetical protein